MATRTRPDAGATDRLAGRSCGAVDGAGQRGPDHRRDSTNSACPWRSGIRPRRSAPSP